MKSNAKTLPSDILKKSYNIIVVDTPWKYSKTIGQGGGALSCCLVESEEEKVRSADR